VGILDAAIEVRRPYESPGSQDLRRDVVDSVGFPPNEAGGDLGGLVHAVGHQGAEEY
jgi:hypothetical protein